jgi:hypothetical protein
LCEEQTLSLNRNEKAAVVTDVAAQAARSQTLALAEYRGLTVAHLNKLRVEARAKGVYLHVLKNTLARRAVAGTPFEVAQGAMVGPLIYGFSKTLSPRRKSSPTSPRATTSSSSRAAPTPARRWMPTGSRPWRPSRAAKC